MTTLPDPGVYHILHYGTHGHHQILTVDKNRNVTISAAGTAVASDQEWRLEIREDKVAIQHRADNFPSSSLSYKGEPEAGKKIELAPLQDLPSRVWHLERAPHLPGVFGPYFISVPGKDLRVVISPKHIFPPQLELSSYHHPHATSWIFEQDVHTNIVIG